MNNPLQEYEKVGFKVMWQRFMSLVGNERRNLYIAVLFIFINSGLNLIAPYLMGQAVDKFVVTHQYEGLIRYSLILLGVFVFALGSGYTQAQLMGRVGQRMMYNLRNSIFGKLQELPIDYFNRNQAGDLISRVNNDTDKINQFFSQSLVQFMSSIFTMFGAGIFLLSIDTELALAALAPALLLWIFTKAVSPWVKKRNASSMKTTVKNSRKMEVMALESCASRLVTIVMAALGSIYFSSSSTETSIPARCSQGSSCSSGIASEERYFGSVRASSLSEVPR